MHFNVAYTQRFRKIYRDLKKSEQELVDKAVELWQQNPENPGSNFEKLTFTGDNIFSIRANNAWRIIMAKFDDTYFLLHTGGQHDKTNDWARNKRIDRNVTTGAIQIYSGAVEEFMEKISRNYETTEKGPFEDLPEEDLLVYGVPGEWIESVRHIKTEDDFMVLWDFLPEDAIENLQVLFDQSIDPKVLLAQIKQEIESRPEDVLEQIKIQPGLFVISEDTSLLEAMNEDISVFRFYLHPSQKLLAYGDFKGSMKVTGSAGTGKTVVAMHRARFLLERMSADDKPLFFTTYTRHLIKNIKAIFAEQQFPEDKLVVNNLHNFALEFGTQLGLFPENVSIFTDPFKVKREWTLFVQSRPYIGFSATFLQEEYEQIIQQHQLTSLEAYLAINRTGRGEALRAEARKSVWNILQAWQTQQSQFGKYTFADLIFHLNNYLEGNPEIRPFSHVICDEIQDFSNLEMRLLRNLVADKPNDLFLCGDPFQNIFQRTLNFSQSGISIRGKRSTRLAINYRTTEEIRKFAVQMLKGLKFSDFSGEAASMAGDISLVNGNDPEYFLFSDQEKFDSYLKDYITTTFGTLGLHELCITARTNKEVERLGMLLQQFKFPVVNLKEVEDIQDTAGKVVLGSMHALKGLEFKNLIVAGFDKQSFPMIPRGFKQWSENRQAEYLKAEHALYYVVFSRAISQLILTGIGEKVPLV